MALHRFSSKPVDLLDGTRIGFRDRPDSNGGHDRSHTQEVFPHHAEALIGGELEGIVIDYSDNAVFITPEGVPRGKDDVHEGFVKLLEDLPFADWDVPTQIFEGDLLFIEWSGTRRRRAWRTGSTRSCSDGSIRVQTVRYALLQSRKQGPAMKVTRLHRHGE